MNALFRFFTRLFWKPADARAYAVVRIAFSIAALANWIQLWPDRQTFFSSTGVIPLDAVKSVASQGPNYSVFFWLTSEQAVTAVMLIAGVAILALGAGAFSRVAAVVVFIWHISYCNRAYPILHGWDSVLRLYAFLLLISPLGRVWSVDRLLKPRATDHDAVPSYGLRLMQWQLFIIYTVTVWLKVPDQYWRSGQMLAYFSVSMYSRTPDDLFLVHHEWLAAIQSYLSLLIEVSVPWLLWRRRTRLLGLIAGFGLHFTIALTAKLEVFSLCMLAPYLAFLETHDIDGILKLLRVRSARQLKEWFTSRSQGGMYSQQTPELVRHNELSRR